MRTPDNYDLFVEHENEVARHIKRLPKCYECDEPIQDDECYEIDGLLICPCCLKENHLKLTENYYID